MPPLYRMGEGLKRMANIRPLKRSRSEVLKHQQPSAKSEHVHALSDLWMSWAAATSSPNLFDLMPPAALTGTHRVQPQLRRMPSDRRRRPQATTSWRRLRPRSLPRAIVTPDPSSVLGHRPAPTSTLCALTSVRCPQPAQTASQSACCPEPWLSAVSVKWRRRCP